MTAEQVHQWCRAQQVGARGIVRGGDFFLGHHPEALVAPCPPLRDVLHWELNIGERSYPTSTSDMERLVTGKLALEEFIKLTGARERRGSE